MSNLKPVIEDSFIGYAGAVLQNRALVDVRDGLKPSSRQIFYSMLLHKLTSDKPHKKTANAVGMAMADFYIHGDSSCEGIIMRAGQPFAMRYPLVEVKGNKGSLIESGNWAAMRYTESRLSKLMGHMFDDINKDTISEWRDNYDNTKQYPAVLPTKGFYNICNGTMGIAVGMASSVPQYNLKELNNALITLLKNPDCSFDDIYCAPDFATGAILYNEKEVKDSMRDGYGAACKLRSVVEYNSKERCFEVTEIPYSVYTNTICKQLEEIVNSDDNPGIDRPDAKNGEKPVVDLTGKTVLIKIYLSKTANPDKVLRYLYKNTSLQSYFGINFTMLDKGRFPKVFTWKEMLQAHIDHEKEVYRRGFEFDLNKIKARIHIIDGLLICLANIDEVIKTIKESASTVAAASALQKNFLLDEVQANAVLDMKLGRLSHLEVKKLEDEREECIKSAGKIEKILNDTELFNQQLINGWEEISKKFGDERRTKVINLDTKNDDEVVETKSLQVMLTNKNNLFAYEVSSLYTQKRGGVGTKIKLAADEFVIASANIETNEELLLFTNNGNYYHVPANQIVLNQVVSPYNLFSIKDSEEICTISSLSKKNGKKYLLFLTKKGIGKKSETSEYNIKRGNGNRAITLDGGDEIANVLPVNEKEIVGILTSQGNFLLINSDDIRETGRVTRGVHAIKLNEEDYVVSARAIPNGVTEIISITGNGYFKKTDYSEFTIQSKNTKGLKIQKFELNDWTADFVPIIKKSDLIIASTRSTIRLTTDDVPKLGRGAKGNKSIKLNPTDNIIKISLC